MEISGVERIPMRRRNLFKMLAASPTALLARPTSLLAQWGSPAFNSVGEVMCVPSIAKLRTIQPGLVPCVVLLGYDDPGDGGGGGFDWDALSKEADNGGTVLPQLEMEKAFVR
jgi:hypothetical protein